MRYARHRRRDAGEHLAFKQFQARAAARRNVRHLVRKCGTNIKLGAENVHWADKGAFTGEISADMLLEQGVE